MPFYQYKIINKNYEKETGSMEALNERQVESIMLSKGYQIISIKKAFSMESIEKQINKLLSTVKVKDMVLFFRQFSVLISASITLSQSLRILSEQIENPSLKAIITEISNEVDAGERLSDAMKKHPKLFSEFHVSVVQSGETSGKLDDSLNYLADEEEKNYEIIKKVRGAMIYPAIVVTAMIGVGIAMMIFVVPKLISIFDEVGGELPIMTRLLIATSNFFVNYWYIAIALIVGIVVFFKIYMGLPFGRKQLDYIVLKLPIFGDIIRKMSVIRFARSMSTLIVGGVTISNSLRIARGIVSNSVYKKLIDETIIEVEEGNSISSVFMHSKEMPVMVPKMMIVGEKTGKLDFVLDRIAIFFNKELQAKLDNLLVLMEPIIMIVMGVAVGLMAAAIILPMYNLTSQF